MDTLNKLMETASSNVGFLVISISIIAVLIGVAYLAQGVINKRQHLDYRKDTTGTKRMMIIGMLSAIAIVLMLFEIPLGFVPGFYKLDFSEIPVIIGAFTLGPVAGLVIELIKILLNLMINGTTSAFVGEFANFLIGCAFVIPASFMYFIRKDKKHAIIGLSIGTVVATIVGGVLNAFVLLPKYAQLFKMPLDALIGIGTEVNGAIQGMSTFILLGVTPFNLIKYSIASIVTILIYKKISYILKGNHN